MRISFPRVIRDVSYVIGRSHDHENQVFIGGPARAHLDLEEAAELAAQIIETIAKIKGEK